MNKRRIVKKKYYARQAECSYYDCKETRNLRQCRYCGKDYCQKHIQAKPTSAPTWIDKQPLWRIKDAHPCPEFTVKPPEQFVMPPIRPYVPPTPPPMPPIGGGGGQDAIRYLRGLWYRDKRGLYDFLRDTLFVMVILIVLNTLLVGGFSLISIAIRSVALVIVFYILEYLYKKTRYVIPWKWVAIAALVIIGAGIYSTGNYSVLKISDYVVGIENFTDKLVPYSVSILTSIPKISISSLSSSPPETQKCADNINNQVVAPLNRLSGKNNVHLIETKHFDTSSEAISYLRNNYLFDDLSKYSMMAYTMSVGMGAPNGRIAGPGIAADINRLSNFSVGIVQIEVNAYGMTTFNTNVVQVCDQNGELTNSSLALILPS